MIRILLHWVMVSAMLLLLANLLPGITITSFQVAMIAIVIFSIINILIRPVLLLLTLPINFLTLGFFTLIINAFLFMVGSSVVQGFFVDGFISALLGSTLLSVTSSLIETIMASPRASKSM